MFLSSPRKALILYGNPGVGKTTLLEYLFYYISSLNLNYNLTGFITKELRENGERIGFDLVYLKDPSYRLPLARKRELLSQTHFKKTSVGRYLVFLENLNKFVELIEKDLSTSNIPSLVFIDEIGKMEAHSEKFVSFLEHLWAEDIPLVATLGKGEHPFLKSYAERWNVFYVLVTIENREFLKARLEIEFYRKGKLIVFEGIDGVGKSTLFQLLQREREFSSFLFSYEPTLGIYGQKIRELLKTKKADPYELLEFFLKDRREHVEKLILPALKKGKVLLLDRYYLSTLAYQGEEETFLELLKQNETFAPLPDLVIYLELEPEEALKRIHHRNQTLHLFEREGELKRIAFNYHKILPLFNYEAVSAWKSVETLLEEIKAILKEFLSKDRI